MKSASGYNILIKAPNWLGDIVLSLPAIGALRTSFPDSSMCTVGNEIVRDVISISGLETDYVCFDRRGKKLKASTGVTPASKGRAPEISSEVFSGSWWEALRTLRRSKWDLGVAFAESFSSALLLRLAGSRKLVGYRTDGRGLILSQALPRQRLGLRPHLVREYMALVEAAGGVAGSEEPRLAIRKELLAGARGMLSGAGVDLKRPLVGLCPGAAYGPSKRWPAARFSGVGRELSSRGASIAVFGAPSEVGLAQEVSRDIPGAVSVAGRTTPVVLAGCLAQCAVVIANDSGAAHLAGAAGAAVVAIFGSTDASWTRPLGSKVVVVRTEDIPCVPCFGKECDRGYACLTGISEADVISAASAVADGPLGW